MNDAAQEEHRQTLLKEITRLRAALDAIKESLEFIMESSALNGEDVSFLLAKQALGEGGARWLPKPEPIWPGTSDALLKAYETEVCHPKYEFPILGGSEGPTAEQDLMEMSKLKRISRIIEGHTVDFDQCPDCGQLFEPDTNAHASGCPNDPHEEITRLRAALQDTFAMIDEGLLVRDISNDASPDYTMNMLKFVRRLAAAKQALGEGDGD